MAKNEDLSLSLSLSASKLTLFPFLTMSSSSSKIQCIYSDEEEAGTWSPVSTLSNICGKRCNREENEGEELDVDNSPKKLRLSKNQSAILEESFKENSTLNPKQKQALAKQLNLRTRQVEVWFQNRRARTKLKHTEVECEYLKRWCEELAEENKRLQKEVMELRAVNRVSTNSNATYITSSSSAFQFQQLSRNSHLNISAAANANPWDLYFPQAS